MRGAILLCEVPGKVARVELKRHFFPTNQNVENMKSYSADKPHVGLQEFGHFGFAFASSPKSEWLTGGHFVAEKCHDFDFFCLDFVKVFHKRLLDHV